MVYPRSERDTLRFTARLVDILEINTTFYRIPAPKTVRSWHERTADRPDFRFAAKLYQGFTHTPDFNRNAVSSFRAALAPLVDHNQLSHLLAQFPWTFRDTPENREQLMAIQNAFGDLATFTVEVRHRSWQQPDALEFLRGIDATITHLDYPRSPRSFSRFSPGTDPDAYVRLHGRNAQAWFDKNAGRDQTYDYLYSPDELDDVAEKIRTISAGSKSVTVIANNHYRGQALVNALELKKRLTGKKPNAPACLVAAYPRLRDSVRTSGGHQENLGL